MITNSRNLTASAQVHDGAGLWYGFIVNSHTSGTIKVWHNTSAVGSVLMDTFTIPTGSGVYTFNYPIHFRDGMYVTLGGSAANVQILVSEQ